MTSAHFAVLFIVGFLNLSIEILTGRLLTPYFGSTLNQWAALIGIVLLCYALGYHFYRAIFRVQPLILLACTGLHLLGISLWVEPVFQMLLGTPLFFGSLLASLLIVGIPAIIWAAFLPYFINLNHDEKKTKKILILSTVGNLLGAWITVLYLIPLFGTFRCFIALSFLSFLCVLLLVSQKMKKTKGTPHSLFFGLFFGLILLSAIFTAKNQSVFPLQERIIQSLGGIQHLRNVITKSTAYQDILIADTKDPHGSPLRFFFISRFLQLIMNPSEIEPTELKESYFDLCSAAPFLNDINQPKKILVIGLGGGKMPWLLKLFKNTKVDVFEIDEDLTDLVKEHLYLQFTPETKVSIGDGRALLQQSKQKYDAIILDVFVVAHLPTHFLTQEFFHLVQDHLAPQGILVANLLTHFESIGILDRMLTTLHHDFKTVNTVRLSDVNTMLIASVETADFKQQATERSNSLPINLRPPFQIIADRIDLHVNAQQGQGVTDDLNDLESQLHLVQSYLFKISPI